MVAIGRLVAIISGSIMIVACILYILSNGIPRWGSLEAVEDNTPVKLTTGLWSGCVFLENSMTCNNLPRTCSKENSDALPLCHKLMVARAFLTIACIISGLSVLCLFACAMMFSDPRRIIIIISKILPLVSFITGIIGVAVGIAYVRSEDGIKIREAAVLGITAVAMNALGVLVAFAIR